MRALERRQHLAVILLDGAAAQHLHAGADAAVEKRDHAAAEMVSDDLQLRVPVVDAVEHQAAHGDRGLVGPAEAPPHLEARARLAGVVRHARRARRVQPDRQVVREMWWCFGWPYETTV